MTDSAKKEPKKGIVGKIKEATEDKEEQLAILSTFVRLGVMIWAGGILTLNYVEIPGEAAFYGPKIDVQVWSAIGREFTLATNQVDFAVPSKFNLTYIDNKSQDKTPLCIHRAPLGTHERFIGFLIEHFAGNFPLWLAPVQISIIPISDKFNDYAQSVYDKLRKEKVRVNLDIRNEKMGAKIRNAELNKIPIMIIIGEKEVDSQTLSVRRKFSGNQGTFGVDDFISSIKEEINSRSL